MTDGTGRGLPIISIQPFLDPQSSDALRHETFQQIGIACREYGFFYVTGHGIPQSRLDQVINLARTFFALPTEEKEKIKRRDAGAPEGGDGARGYQGMGENVTQGRRDMHEAVDLYREWDGEPSKKQPPYKTLQGPNLWPEKPKELKPVYLDYISQLRRVGEALVRAMGKSLELGKPMPNANIDSEDEETFVRNTDDPFWVMRMIGYPPLEAPRNNGHTISAEEDDLSELSCGEHTDYGCVTLLLSDPTPGALQVKLQDGTWLNADPIPGAFVVNIGDMIERWTNGIWKSTRHRVIHRGDGYRVSVPFFFEPNFDAVVKPLASCVQASGGKPLFEATTYGGHLLGKVFSNFY
jgi:isopenicillin N synthase-like dioxygenase